MGMPVAVGQGGNMEQEVEYGNRKSLQKFATLVWQKVVDDVVAGLELVFPWWAGEGV